MRFLPGVPGRLAAALLVLVGCDSAGIGEQGICLIGDQPALRNNDIDVTLGAPATGDTLRLGEPFPLRATVDAVGPDIVEVDVRLQVFRIRRNEGPSQSPVLLDIPLVRADRDTSFVIDRSFAIGRLGDGVVSSDLDDDESLYLGVSGLIRFPVESEGPGCGTTLSGTGTTPFARLTVLNAQPTP